MVVSETSRGFEIIKHQLYAAKPGVTCRLVQQSSAVGAYDDAIDRPGSSFLWVGASHHLDRDEVRELVERLQLWLATGSMMKGGGK